MSNAAKKTALVVTLKSVGIDLRPVQIKALTVETMQEIIDLSVKLQSIPKTTPWSEDYSNVYNQRAALIPPAKPGASFNQLKRAAFNGNPAAINALRKFVNSK